MGVLRRARSEGSPGAQTDHRVDNAPASGVVFAARQGVSAMVSQDSAAASGAEFDVALCEQRIGHRFSSPELLIAAVTHASGARHRLASNERLEFLGDAILGFIVCEGLFRRFPDSLEGDLTQIKSVVVSRDTCSRLSRQLGLAEFVIVGKGLASGPAVPESVLSDMFEAVVAALYLDGGMEVARPFVERLLGPEIDKVASGESGSNHKSLPSSWPSGISASLPPTKWWQRRGQTIARVSTFRPRSEAAATPRPGAGTRRRRNSWRRRTRSANSALRAIRKLNQTHERLVGPMRLDGSPAQD